MLAVVIVIVLVAVVVLGLLIFWLIRRAQTEVPAAADARTEKQPQVVGADEQGHSITGADEPAVEPRDDAPFEAVLQDEIRDRGMQQPRAGDDA